MTAASWPCSRSTRSAARGVQAGCDRVRPLSEGDAAGRGLERRALSRRDRAPASEQDRRANGIEVEDATWYRLKALAEDYKLTDRLGFGDVE